MATVQGTVSVETLDKLGISGTTLYNVDIDDSQTIALLMTDVNDLAGAQDPLTQGRLESVSVKIFGTPSGGTAAGDIEKGALFNFNNATDAYATGVFIPDVNPSILNASGLVDLTNVNVTAFVTFLTTAHTVITVVTKGVRALTTLKDALIAFRKHRKPLSRRTKEV